jgi:zinc transport system ATP-binding protein
MQPAVIEIEGLSFAYNGQLVLQDVGLKVRAGEFMAMIGPNGGGKTTLLKLMLGLLTPDRGAIRVFGRPPREASHRIGYVPQNVHANTEFPISVLDVVVMGKLNPSRKWRRPGAADRKQALQILDQVEMGAYRDRRIGELSGGQRQRVMVARALVGNPEALFLDEPTASIDAKGQQEFFGLLKELNKTVTIIVVSHDLMVVSGFATSVACVNQRLHYHGQAEITQDMIDVMYRCATEDVCPVELISHGLPRRVLPGHRKDGNDRWLRK